MEEVEGEGGEAAAHGQVVGQGHHNQEHWGGTIQGAQNRLVKSLFKCNYRVVFLTGYIKIWLCPG